LLPKTPKPRWEADQVNLIIIINVLKVERSVLGFALLSFLLMRGH